MNYREKWRERVRDICASGTTWWWWLLMTKLNHIEPFLPLIILYEDSMPPPKKKNGIVDLWEQMYKQNLVLNTLKCLICHKTKPNQTKPNQERGLDLMSLGLQWRPELLLLSKLQNQYRKHTWSTARKIRAMKEFFLNVLSVPNATFRIFCCKYRKRNSSKDGVQVNHLICSGKKVPKKKVLSWREN